MRKNKVDIVFFDKANKIDYLDKSLFNERSFIKKSISKILNETVRLKGIKEMTIISVIIVEGHTAKEINKYFRKKNKEASVLSFPLKSSSEFITPQEELFLGDIIINLKKIKKENKDFNRGLKENIVHAFLHLLSYNHDTEKEFEKMQEEEKKLLKALNDI